MALAVMYSAVTAAIGAWTVLPIMYFLIREKTFYLHTNTFFSFIYRNTSRIYIGFVGSQEDAANPQTNNTQEGTPIRQLNGVDQPLQMDAYSDELQGGKFYGMTEEHYRKVTNGYWYRTVRFVMQYPLPFLVALLGCLSGLMYVFISQVKFGAGGTSLLPINSAVRTAFDDFIKYIPGGIGTELDVFMQTTNINGTQDAAFLIALDDYSSQISAISSHVIGIKNMVRFNVSTSLNQYIQIYSAPYSTSNFPYTKYLIAPFYYTDFNEISRTAIFLDLDPNSQETYDIVRKAREITSGSNVTSFLQAYGVTGAPAEEFDTIQDLISTFPYFVAVLISSMLLFMTLLSGSFVIPIKAVITAALSIISSFAFIVLVFQDGPQNAQNLLKFIPNHTLDPTNLLFIFAVSFGLSLDYEIFMISRIHEFWEKTKDHPFSVAAGIEESARAITLAALLLCIVLGSFLASQIIPLKEIGMGIALTILIDATVIRCILVPAMMAILGQYTWWAPKIVQDFVKIAGLMEKYDHLDESILPNDEKP